MVFGLAELRATFVEVIVRPPRQTRYALLGGAEGAFNIGRDARCRRRDFVIRRRLDEDGLADDDEEDTGNPGCGVTFRHSAAANPATPTSSRPAHPPRQLLGNVASDDDDNDETRFVKIRCSHYTTLKNDRIRDAAQIKGESAFVPVVVYAHGNSGSRADATEAAVALLPYNIDVVCFDFSGSGQSGGEYCTLGANEQRDLAAVIAFVRCARVAFAPDSSPMSPGGMPGDSEACEEAALVGATFAESSGSSYFPQFGHVALWGRSMGAVSSVLYASRDAGIAALVLDSPFSQLTRVMADVAQRSVRIPRALCRLAIGIVARGVRSVAGFDVRAVDTVAAARACHMPVLHAHACDDGLIDLRHAHRLYTAYGGADKRLVLFGDGADHNSIRPTSFYAGAADFLVVALRGGLKDPDRLFAAIVGHADSVVFAPLLTESGSGGATARQVEAGANALAAAAAAAAEAASSRRPEERIRAFDEEAPLFLVRCDRERA